MRAARLHLLLVATISTTSFLSGVAADEPQLTREETRQFLLTAEIVKSRAIGRGTTGAKRLTLSDGRVTHDAAFVTVDERKGVMEFSKGGRELNFVDSYHYNIAAAGIAELLGLEEMSPVHVERAYLNQRGSLSWWIEAAMEEGERLKKNIQPPNPNAWNRQMYKMRVFANLVYDTDRNLGNALITPDWKLWMIDYTRAFRLWKQIKSPGDLTQCDRQLLERLRQLTAEAVEEKTRPHLSKWEIEAVMARRDLIVAHFEKLVAQKGEAAVLY
jgi:hypothetical protein